jgi:hypothetical protein
VSSAFEDLLKGLTGEKSKPDPGQVYPVKLLSRLMTLLVRNGIITEAEAKDVVTKARQDTKEACR